MTIGVKIDQAMGGQRGEYDDIIDLPHYQDLEHGQMSMRSRAAQFAAYKALGEDLCGDEWRDDEYSVELFDDSDWPS